MANIKHLQMGKTICGDARVSVATSLFGLRTTATYRPTGSPIDVRVVELSPNDGDRLKRILATPRQALADAIGGFRPTPVVNGNYQVELCASRDGEFAAIQLAQFNKLCYEPVTDVITLEGEDARLVAGMF